MKYKISLHILFVFTLAATISACNKNPNRVYFTINPNNRQINIPVLLDDSIRAKMTFDTGWNPIALDSSFCASNSILILNNPDTIIKRGTSWSHELVTSLVYDKCQAVKIGSVDLNYPNLHIRDIKIFFNTDADGILGIPPQDTAHVWELNFEHNYLEVHSATGFQMPKNCFLLKNENHAFDVKLSMQIKCSDGDTLSIDRIFMIDTGMPEDIAVMYPSSEWEFFNKKEDAVCTTSDGKNYKRRYTVSATLFDHFDVDSLRIYLFDDPHFVQSKYLIGQNFLKRFNVFFDQKNRQIGLQPIKNFQRIVNPNHTRLYFFKEKTPAGQYVVKKVIDYKGNPYKEAGLKEGDEIITINGKLFKNLTHEDMLELEKADTIQWVFLRGREQITITVPADKYYDRGD